MNSPVSPCSVTSLNSPNSEASVIEPINIIFVDWDDTLMPSTYIVSQLNYNIYDKDQRCDKLEMKKSANKEDFIENLKGVGHASFDLLSKICTKYETTNVKIVTNGSTKWFHDSLIITGYYCKIWNELAALIKSNNIQIIFARDLKTKHAHWKINAFDQLMWPYFNDKTSVNLNITSVGDQWHDHLSVEKTFTFEMYGDCIRHHQIKLFPNPDYRYLRVELEYILDIVGGDVLFKHDDCDENGKLNGIIVEFEGYHDEQNAC